MDVHIDMRSCFVARVFNRLIAPKEKILERVDMLENEAALFCLHTRKMWQTESGSICHQRFKTAAVTIRAASISLPEVRSFGEVDLRAGVWVCLLVCLAEINLICI